MKAYLINMHLLVPRSRSSAKVKVKYKGYISQKMALSGAFVFHKHVFFLETFFKNKKGIIYCILKESAIEFTYSVKQGKSDKFQVPFFQHYLPTFNIIFDLVNYQSF